MLYHHTILGQSTRNEGGIIVVETPAKRNPNQVVLFSYFIRTHLWRAVYGDYPLQITSLFQMVQQQEQPLLQSYRSTEIRFIGILDSCSI